MSGTNCCCRAGCRSCAAGANTHAGQVSSMGAAALAGEERGFPKGFPIGTSFFFFFSFANVKKLSSRIFLFFIIFFNFYFLFLFFILFFLSEF